ncbi:MAG TPA: universal stress protein [Anaerolineales bacterium]|nr:universal stress protein [Anaerolineales bacterium]
MFQNILVPLDGSALSESALPYAESLAGPLKATLHLMMAVSLPSARGSGMFRLAASFLPSVQLPGSEADLDATRHPVYKESEMASLEAEAKSYLLPTAERLQAKGLAVEVAVRFGRPAGEIFRYAQAANIELIVMCTHGEGGPDAYAYGPTADRVARRAPCPVMLIRPEEVMRVLPVPEAEEPRP